MSEPYLLYDELRAGTPRIRERFPALKNEMNERPLVYLDTAATAQKPESVIGATRLFYEQYNSSPHRGIYRLSEQATSLYEGCRSRVAEFVNAGSPESVVITRNATHALNMVAAGFEHRLQAGDEILLTEMEHHANIVPWVELAKRKGIKIRVLPITETGFLDLDRLPEYLSKKTRIVSVTAVSNVLGTINPLKQLAEAAHAVGALFVVDAAQAVGHLPLDMQDIGADLLVFSAHKMYGPTGLGFLIGHLDVLEEMHPFEGGGQMIDEVTFENVTFAPVPMRFEAGTPNVAAAVTFPPALDLIEEIGMKAIRSHEIQLTEYALSRLQTLPELDILGPRNARERGGLIAFVDRRVQAYDLALMLSEQGIAVRAGHQCAQPLHKRLGLDSSVRASFGIYSEQSDVDELVEGIQFARNLF